MVRTLVALLLVVCLGMLLTVGASAQEPPGNQQVQSSAVRDFALVGLGLLGGLLGGWGGAFISGWWSTKNLDKQLKHEAEQNRLSLEQRTREYMRDYRQKRVDDLLQMIISYDQAIDGYHTDLMAGMPVPPPRPGVDEPSLAWAVVLLGETPLREVTRELLGMYNTMLDAMEKKPSAVTEHDRKVIYTKIVELATVADEYIALG